MKEAARIEPLLVTFWGKKTANIIDVIFGVVDIERELYCAV